VVKFQEFLAGYTVIGRYAETVFKEKKIVFELEKGVPFWVLDDGSEKYIFRK
jgi:hypothetical protein